MLPEIIAKMPKIELHCHLDGSLSLACIKQLAQNAQIELPDSDAAILEKAQAPDKTKDLLEYLVRFDFVLPLLQTAENLELAAFDVAEQAASDNIKYIEIRFAPMQHLHEGLSLAQTVEAVIAGCKRAEVVFDLKINVLVCGLKHENARTLKNKLMPIFSEITDSHLAGFDLAGDELNNPISKFRYLIEEAVDKSIQVTLHAGECPYCGKNMLDAVKFGATRLGHGVCARELTAVELQGLIDQKILLEMAPSSNFQTKAVENLADYPFKKLYDAGVHVTLNTDNRTVSNTTLNKEYQKIATWYDFKLPDFEQINHYAIDGAFTTQAEKLRLHQLFQAEFAEI